MRLVRVLGAALVAAAVGCASGSPAPPAAEAGAEQVDLTAVAGYGRHAAVRGKADVRLANRGPAAVEVVRLRVEHPLFEPVPALERRSTLPPDGRARIVPVPFGAPRCDAPSPAGAAVVVGVRTVDGVVDVAVRLDDGEPGLLRAHRLACAAADVTDTATLDLTAPQVGPDLVARAALTLRRRGPGAVVVSSLGGNILFVVDVPPGEPLLALPADQDAAEVQVQVRASRCEAHALTESKTSSTFPVFAAVDGGESTLVPLTVSAPTRAALQDLLRRTCGPGR